jgi:RNAse (barnase) inhibitor barstar
MSARPALAPGDSGVYASPVDISELRTRAEQIGASWADVDLTLIRDKATLLRAFGDALTFPPEFGQNWDALYDSLQDLAWLPASGYVLRLRNIAGARQALGAEWDTLLDILHKSASFWKTRKPFIVIAEGVRDLPAWF